MQMGLLGAPANAVGEAYLIEPWPVSRFSNNPKNASLRARRSAFLKYTKFIAGNVGVLGDLHSIACDTQNDTQGKNTGLAPRREFVVRL